MHAVCGGLSLFIKAALQNGVVQRLPVCLWDNDKARNRTTENRKKKLAQFVPLGAAIRLGFVVKYFAALTRLSKKQREKKPCENWTRLTF